MVAPFQGQDLDARYLGFFHYFNRQLYFEAHEVLEDLWLDNSGANYSFYKGLIQMAGAFVHVQKHRVQPAAALLKLAKENLRPYPPIHDQLNLRTTALVIEHWLTLLGKAHPVELTDAPELVLEPGKNPDAQLPQSRFRTRGAG